MAQDVMSALRQTLAALDPEGARGAAELFSLGAPALDDALGGGLARAALHEMHAAEGVADAAALAGFGLGLALRAAGTRPMVWVRQTYVDTESGWLYGAGLSAFGLDPSRLILVRARDPTGVLRAAAEAARCAALGAVIAELWGNPPVLDLKATRRLAMAVQSSKLPMLLMRLGAEPGPGAATSRWSVAARPSVPLEANAPGRPAFNLRLLRHRAGIAGRVSPFEKTWPVEWDRDRLAFQDPAPLPRAVVPVPLGQPAAADAPERAAPGWRKAG